MQLLNYCVDCQRVFSSNDQCEYCGSYNTKCLKKSTSVNVIGTKIKGKVINCKEGVANIVVFTEAKEKVIKECEIKNLKKIL